MRAIATLAGMLALFVVAIGCAAGPAPVSPPGQPTTAAAGDVAATVNGRPISMALYQAQLRTALASFAPEPGVDSKSTEVAAALRAQVLAMLIDQALIDQAAETMGIDVDEAQVNAEVERMRSQNQGSFAAWLSDNGYTEETFHAQTRSDLLGAAVRDRVTRDVAGKVEQVHLRQIVLAGEAQARDLAAQLRSNPAAFEALAVQRSIDEDTRSAGGDLGFVPRGLLPLSVEKVGFSLQPGQISDPVQSPLGWHVLKLEAREAARDVPPEMLPALRQEMFMRWLDEERAKARIERYVQ